MADNPAPKPPLIERLWAVVLSPSASDSERIAALHGVDRHLASVGSDGYQVIERIKTPPVSDEDMKKIFDTGIETGIEMVRAEIEAEQRKRVTATPPMPIFGVPTGSTTFSRFYGFDDNDRISGHDTFKGNTWSEIANHCYANLDRIPDKHHGFLEDMADKLTYGSVSGKQAKYLGNLFRQYLSGRI